ncbi:MAG: tetraacyldisaccharide 4'-kinase [Alistipes sp.]|nr:tetraacyldisaccharide 4'-kinase [Alistipes sp.]MBP3601904.1 tetraacyldisaccharide 4'-kinase [Alistipes sp.]
MGFLMKLLSYPYRMAITLRHWMFDCKLIKSQNFKTPIICVGNITVGGTGKTPTAEMIVGYMKQYYNVAVLSRGYGRRTKGYLEVKTTSSYRDVGDEPLQIKLKYPDALVVVCEKRTEAIHRIEAEHPEINLIVMDDGFQHRYVEPRINVVIVDSTRPYYEDDYLPAGTLRDKPESLDRAHYFIVTKCPVDMSPLDQRVWRMNLHKIAYQRVYFTRVIPTLPVAQFPTQNVLNEGDEVIVMSGIGNPKAFISDVKRNYNVVGTITFPDHHVYSVADIERIVAKLEKHPKAMLLTTEKDTVKLRRSRRVPDIMRERLFYQPVQVEFLEGSDVDFLGTLKSDLEGKVHLDSVPKR